MISGESLLVLENSGLCRGMTPDECRQLARFGFEMAVRPGDAIIREGQPGQALYVLLAGTCKVMLLQSSRPGDRFSDVELNTLRKGDCFGEYSFIDGQAASATVKAVEEGRVFQLSRPNFDQLVASSDRLARLIYQNMIGILVRRLRKKDLELDFTLDSD